MADKLVKNASPNWGGKRENSGPEKKNHVQYNRQVDPEWIPILDAKLKELREKSNPPR